MEGPGVYQKDPEGGPLQLVAKRDLPVPRQLTDWSRDGRVLVYAEYHSNSQHDIWYVPVETGKLRGDPVKVLGSEASETQGQLSPDGKWLAYCSDDSGKFEVYIRPFPAGPGVRKVSVDDSGREPRWRADGKELYFVSFKVNGRETLMAVSVLPDGRSGLRIGRPERLFEARAEPLLPQNNVFSYSPEHEGQRFLMSASAETGQRTLKVVMNWHTAVTEATKPH